MPRDKPKAKPKRKTPLTASVASPAKHAVRAAPALSAKLTQATISKFHTLLKRKAQLQGRLKNTASSTDHAKIEQDLNAVREEMDALGGLERYQTMSKVGQGRERGGDSSKVLVEWLLEMGLGPKGKGKAIAEGLPKLRLLEIGALSPTNYAAQSSWILNTPLDLHSQHPSILEQDFMQRPIPSSDAERHDIVSCSLVLNFVPEPKGRGRMLRLIRQHLLPSPSSLLFLVLPLPCITNSRYLSRGLLIQIMAEVGFSMVHERSKTGGKVGYWLFKWAEPVAPTARTRRKRIICDGPGKNNFAVVLDDPLGAGDEDDVEDET